MNYAIRAWRQGGSLGITVTTVFPAGDDNYIAEFDLPDAEVDQFLAACADARQRARDAAGPLHELLPGAYESLSGVSGPVSVREKRATQ